MRVSRFSKFCFLFAILWVTLCCAVGCSTAWTSEASAIVGLLPAAVASFIGILAAFGKGVPPTVMTSVNAWAQDAQAAFKTVESLIQQYEAAEATAKPGILTEISTAINTVLSNLSAILPEIKVTDPATQAKVTAIITAVQSEMTALLNIIPVFQGAVTSHDEAKALVAKVKTAKEFKAEFNGLVGEFGTEYTI